MTKPFKCVIKDCIKVEVAPEKLEGFKPNLGYFYICRFIGHPQFGTTGKLAGAQTSLVVKEYEEGGKQFIETLNSVYEKGDLLDD